MGMTTDIARLRELSERATPGPWVIRHQRIDGADPVSVADNHNSIWRDIDGHLYPVFAVSRVRPAEDGGEWPPAAFCRDDDAALIIALRNDADALLAQLEAATARIGVLETTLNRGRCADQDCPIAAHLDDMYTRSDDDQDKMHLAMAAYELRRGPFDHPDHFGCEIEADDLRERIGALASAVKNILPIGDASKPDSAVFPIYVRMSELRALHDLASQEAA